MHQASLVCEHAITAYRDMLLWMTPSEAPKALHASECGERTKQAGSRSKSSSNRRQKQPSTLTYVHAPGGLRTDDSNGSKWLVELDQWTQLAQTAGRARAVDSNGSKRRPKGH